MATNCCQINALDAIPHLLGDLVFGAGVSHLVDAPDTTAAGPHFIIDVV